MKNKLLIWSIIYFVGILLLVVSGIQEIDWILYASIILGLVGIIYTFIMKKEIE